MTLTACPIFRPSSSSSRSLLSAATRVHPASSSPPSSSSLASLKAKAKGHGRSYVSSSQAGKVDVHHEVYKGVPRCLLKTRFNPSKASQASFW